MFQRFIHRPVLAIVVSLLVVFVGGLAIRGLPVSQFPDVAPPVVLVSIAYPGASAEVLVDSTIINLERAINGVPGMKYMVSDSTSAGEATIQVIFDQGTDPNVDFINVKSRVDQVMTQLPSLVQLEGVVVTTVQPSMLMYLNLFSTDENADEAFLYNYAQVHLLPELQRVDGVGSARILGSRRYAMRIWLDPDRMRAYRVSVEDVMEAIAEQSVIGRPGRIGMATGRTSQSREYVLTYAGRFDRPEQYEDIIVRATPDGEILRLSEMAEVELGSEFFDIYSNLDGHPSAAIVLKQTYDSNASEVIDAAKARMEELREAFPPHMDFTVSYDVSTFLDASVEQVLHTLAEAFLLVALVVFVFLGDWRSTLVPTLAVPVSLVGSFIVMQAFDLTINLITLFALVLSIGIVVDNAIVVVEAVNAKMEEDPSLAPYDAVVKVVGEISGAIIAITLVMTAVFVPIAFMSGPIGIFYRQFAITMAASIVLSGFVALTLTPVLCAMILKNTHGKPKRKTPIAFFIALFDRVFHKVTGIYVAGLERIVDRRLVTLGMLAAFGMGIFALDEQLPAGFIPSEDQGLIYAIIQTPPGTTLERTNAVAHELQRIATDVEGVESVSSLAGYEILTEGRGSNAGTCLINLESWSSREHSVHEIIEELEERSEELGATIEFFEPPAVPGYGAAGGIALRMLDVQSETDYQEFDRVNREFMAHLEERPELTGLFTFYAANYPQYELVIDNALAMQKGVSIGHAMETLSILIGSTYEQGFIRFGNFFKVYVQALPQFRDLPNDILGFYVRNDEGEMVPYSAFMSIRETQGPNEITRYNVYNSSAIRGVPAPGYTSDDAIRAIREVAEQTLPRGYDIAWEGLSFDEARRGNETLYVFLIVLAFVYLVLAAQYESFVIPLAVILSLPAGVFGAFALLTALGLANDVYAQVGLVMLVGLLGKNAVLIVEFAAQAHAKGMSVRAAAIEGAKVRFRPILMTSFAFVAGLLPLVVATGPGAVGNRTIGASSLGGMLLGTLFGVIVVPGLYFLFGTIAGRRPLVRDEYESPVTEGKDD
jgi:hydrophobic/amphiphilic exporter-1 (mainly G- bacteria), HAE1 family